MWFNNRGQTEMKQYVLAVKEFKALGTSVICKALLNQKRQHEPELHRINSGITG